MSVEATIFFSRNACFCSRKAFALFKYSVRELALATTVNMVTPDFLAKSCKLHALPSGGTNSTYSVRMSFIRTR